MPKPSSVNASWILCPEVGKYQAVVHLISGAVLHLAPRGTYGEAQQDLEALAQDPSFLAEVEAFAQSFTNPNLDKGEPTDGNRPFI